MKHDFVLVKEPSRELNDLRNYHHNPEAVLIEDDLILYLLDLFNIIPTINPSLEEKNTHGLSYYGFTIVESRGALVLINILSGFIQIIKSANEILELRGMYVHGDENEPGYYETLKVNRDETIEKFNQLIILAEEVVESKDKFFLLHIGI